MNTLKISEKALNILESPPAKLTVETLETMAAFYEPFAAPMIEAGYYGTIHFLKAYGKTKRETLLQGINERRGDDSPIELTDKKLVELFQAIKAIDRTSSLKKIDFIGKLYAGYAIIEEEDDVDFFEEMLEAINSLSFRQIRMLVELKDIEDINNSEGGTEDKPDYFPQFMECCKDKGLSPGMVVSLLESAAKSGFCRQEVASYKGNAFTRYETTEYFSKVVQYALNKK